MKWKDARQSSNVEDQRGRGGVVGGGIGIGTLVLAAIVYFMGGNPLAVIQGSGGVAPSSQTSQSQQAPGAGTNDEEKQFVPAVLGSTEDVWKDVFAKRGKTYRPPKLVLFSNRVQSACGLASSASGPFYCPGDQKLYLDTAFFREMQTQLNAPGDFARAYVIAHEVGHHVQNLLGTMDKVNSLEERANKKQANALSVKLELQADFYAGVWAHYAQQRGLVESGDINEALGAASAVGDDRLQKECRARLVHARHLATTPAMVRARVSERRYNSGRYCQRSIIPIGNGIRVAVREKLYLTTFNSRDIFCAFEAMKTPQSDFCAKAGI